MSLGCQISMNGKNSVIQKNEEKVHFSHTTASFNIMISAFSEKLNILMAEKLFHEMGDKGCSLDAFTYLVLIDCFCVTGNTDSGHKFLLEMINEGFTPSLTTFGRVINCLCVNRRVNEAVVIIHLMVSKGIYPEIVNTIFAADKKAVAAPKILVEELLKKSHITYDAYELLYNGVRDKKKRKKILRKKCS